MATRHLLPASRWVQDFWWVCALSLTYEMRTQVHSYVGCVACACSPPSRHLDVHICFVFANYRFSLVPVLLFHHGFVLLLEFDFLLLCFRGVFVMALIVNHSKREMAFISPSCLWHVCFVLVISLFMKSRVCFFVDAVFLNALVFGC